MPRLAIDNNLTRKLSSADPVFGLPREGLKQRLEKFLEHAVASVTPELWRLSLSASQGRVNPFFNLESISWKPYDTYVSGVTALSSK